MVAATFDVLPPAVIYTSLIAIGHSSLDANGNPRLRFLVALELRVGAGASIEVDVTMTTVALE